MEEQLTEISYNLETIRNSIGDLIDYVDRIEVPEINSCDSIISVELFKEKLELYGFRTEELWNFIDDYMRLYNK